MNTGIDILMITYNRPEYTRLSLNRLLDTATKDTRVWVWHNGTHAETLEVVQSHLDHSRLYRFHHSRENVKLNEPTNWLWRESGGQYVGKVDDDCLVSKGWIEAVRGAHEAVPEFGVISCWHFAEEDFDAELARPKIRQFDKGYSILQNCWIGGSGYLMKRRCVEEQGLLRTNQNFPQYCQRLALSGWINGWLYPFVIQEHMDDPRSAYTLLKSDEDVKKYAPLSAQARGVSTVQAWQAQLKESARIVQRAPIDPRYYFGWRRIARGLHRRALRLAGRITSIR